MGGENQFLAIMLVYCNIAFRLFIWTKLRAILYILKVLGKCQLREAVQEKEKGLDSLGKVLFY